MKIFEKYGSKERLFELMGGVNKININENKIFDEKLDIFDKKNYINNEDDSNIVDRIESDEVTDDDVAELDAENEFDGEKLVGGEGDDQTEASFDIEQIKKGLKVELEHTNDPLIALEIVYDHLTENETYYDKLEDMESSFDKEGSDEDLISSLMGWSPKNVGDYSKTGGDNYIEPAQDYGSDSNGSISNNISSGSYPMDNVNITPNRKLY